jgi:arylsulfatase A-like enzyme
MNSPRLLLLSLLLVIVAGGAARSFGAEKAARPNVLFIAVDDLNHWVGHLGRNRQARTPNIDRLAKMGVTFTRAYCAAPVCNPSRAALLSGLRPSTSGVYDNGQNYHQAFKVTDCLPMQFKNSGYRTLAAGKLYHGGVGETSQWDVVADRTRADAQPKPGQDTGVGGIKFAPLDCKDDELVDWGTASFAIEHLTKKSEQPFFLAIGFHKPHMPWNVPKKYFDMFPLESIELPPHTTNDLADVPAIGKSMAKPDGDHAAMLKSGRWKEAVQAYLATIAYFDMNLGRVLDAFEKSPARTNTIVVFWGDHGWHLGEKEHWRKFALWEESTRAPFIWVAPGVTKSGGVCERPVDFMSVYPTLCDLAGIARPKHVEGDNIRSLLANPRATWTNVAITTFRRNNHAVRTERWRYIQYADGGEELYDHTKDPLEWKNMADDPAFAREKKELAARLPKVNKPELPGQGGGRRKQQ